MPKRIDYVIWNEKIYIYKTYVYNLNDENKIRKNRIFKFFYRAQDVLKFKFYVDK